MLASHFQHQHLRTQMCENFRMQASHFQHRRVRTQMCEYLTHLAHHIQKTRRRLSRWHLRRVSLFFDFGAGETYTPNHQIPKGCKGATIRNLVFATFELAASRNLKCVARLQ